MTTETLKFKELYTYGADIQGRDFVEYRIALHYYMASLIGFSNTKTLYEAFDHKWEDTYSKVFSNSVFRFNATQLYNSLEKAINKINGDDLNDKSRAMIVNNRENIINFMKRSGVDEPMFSDKKVAMFNLTTEANVGAMH